eukprot:753108-Hanusia_phi.AAC.1
MLLTLSEQRQRSARPRTWAVNPSANSLSARGDASHTIGSSSWKSFCNVFMTNSAISDCIDA